MEGLLVKPADVGHGLLQEGYCTCHLLSKYNLMYTDHSQYLFDSLDDGVVRLACSERW